MRKLFLLFALCCASTQSLADEVTKEELVFLPPYCMGTQLIRDVSGNKTPIETYMKRYGPEYWHLHHYCWALNGERKAITAPENGDNARGIMSRSALLEYSRGNLEYVLARSSNNFVFLPEILETNARVLYRMGRKGEAIASLVKATKLRPDYWKAYAKLSDYYRDSGNKKDAIQILENGLSSSPGNVVLINRLRKLGAEPDPRFLNPPEKEISSASPDNESREESDHEDLPPFKIGTDSNPYCRFCSE